MTNKQQEALAALIASGRTTKKELEQFSEQELTVIAQSTLEYLDKGESLTMKDIELGDYLFEMPDIVQFIEDPYYLGNELGYPRNESGSIIKGKPRQIYTYWLEQLEKIYTPGEMYTEVLITGAIGGGKSTGANVIQAYDLLHLLALKNPQKHYGLMPSTTIVLAFFSILKELSTDVGYAQFQGMLDSSPCFNSLLHRNKRLSEGFQMIPPKDKNIKFVLGSRATHTLGKAVFSAVLDEANFGQSTTDKNADEKTSQVYDNYTNLLRRKKSRFLHAPGHFCIISSKKGEADFLEQHIEKSKGQKGVYVIDAPIYEFKKCRGEYSKKTFRVLLGDLTRNPRVLKDDEKVPSNLRDKVRKVPVNLKKDFDTNIIEALRDLAGIAAQPKSAFFSNRDQLRALFDKSRKSPWKYSASSKIPNTVNISFRGTDQISDFLIKERLFCNKGKLPFADKPRFLAVDTGVTGDACGISMVCKCGVRVLKTDKKSYFVPKYYADFYIRLKGKNKDPFPLYKITEFVKYLRNGLSINIKGVSTDGYQSTEMRQNISIAFPSMIVELLSVDADDIAYLSLRNNVTDGTLTGLYPDKNLLVEALDLQHIVTGQRGTKGSLIKMKVDHPRIASDGFVGRKDVIDSLTSALYSCKVHDTAASIEEIQEQVKEIKNIDIDSVIAEADKSVEDALKKVDDINLDNLLE